MRVIMRYLLSNQNLAGCAAASGVIGLFLTHVLTGWVWIPIAVTGYAAAAFVTKPVQSELALLPEGLSTEKYLSWLNLEALPNLPPEAAVRLRNILDLANEIWPRLKEMQEQGLVQVQNRTMLKQMLTQMLPQLIQNYLKLPTIYAKTHRVDGKTPLMMLIDQLTLLESHITELRNGVYAQDVDSLLASGKFLQEKFSQSLRIG